MMTAMRDKPSDDLAERARLLSPRRLIVLTSAFVAALAVLMALQVHGEGVSRRTETVLRVDRAASECATGLNLAILTGGSVREALTSCHPGGVAAVFHLSRNGDILNAYGATRDINLDPGTAGGLTLSARGGAELKLRSGRAAANWRPLDNGETVLAAAPARDIYNRSPVWLGYAFAFAAVSVVIGSLLAAFLRQSSLVAESARAVESLNLSGAALKGGRCSPWFYDYQTRAVTLARTLLEPLGLGARDRVFTLRELTALIHPEDLRGALAILTGETSGQNEGAVRLREPGGGWSRVYLRTSPEATRFMRAGVAFDLAGAKTISPGAAIAESRLKDAIENVPEAFVLWDAQGRLAVWNRRFASIFRFPERMLKAGLTASELAAIARTRGDIIVQYFAPEAPLDQQSVEVAFPGDRWLHVSRRRTAEGGLVCVASNVTDLKRRARAQKKKERELKATVTDLEASRSALSETMQKYELEKHRAEEASRSKSEFLANMSHELRTPLNAINGFSEIMQSELYGPVGDTKYKEYVNDILASGRHLLELIDDILDMSKIEAGKLELEPRRVELEKVLQESIRLVAKRAADAGVKLTAHVGHAPAVWADQRAVKQVVLNLLSNAIKFTTEGGEVAVTAEADLDGVTIIVADSGAGIEKAQLRRLGSPFAMIEDDFAKARHGAGLGLALSKSLMEMQGGILAIASQRGRGTVACATFPRRPDAKVRLPQFVRSEAHVLTGQGPRENLLLAPPEAAE